jgi:cytosine/adenosine deaminase-related metal-dependent hydrolase
MPAGYDANGLAANQRELRTFGGEVTVDRGPVVLAGADEAAELRDRALRLLAVGVGDHTPVEVQEQVAEIAPRLVQLEPPAHRWR